MAHMLNISKYLKRERRQRLAMKAHVPSQVNAQNEDPECPTEMEIDPQKPGTSSDGGRVGKKEDIAIKLPSTRSERKRARSLNREITVSPLEEEAVPDSGAGPAKRSRRVSM
ncbi:uncharacterized protein LOC115882506 [Sitophilus oryzae]|uniref:Uncharacterized protein LOC115882506 n=1 Tax=Sitophilus oryzae TaxID=7048 RepID=A0A6J2Y089_SITOR|nr:uncharacterized protein LOC115882506 [Sitophilus oryzae]